MKAKEVMKVLNISRRTLTRYVKQNLIKIDYEINGRYCYNEESVYGLVHKKAPKKEIDELKAYYLDLLDKQQIYYNNIIEDLKKQYEEKRNISKN